MFRQSLYFLLFHQFETLDVNACIIAVEFGVSLVFWPSKRFQFDSKTHQPYLKSLYHSITKVCSQQHLQQNLQNSFD